MMRRAMHQLHLPAPTTSSLFQLPLIPGTAAARKIIFGRPRRTGSATLRHLPGDNLIFPAGAAQLINFNDYPSGTVFGSVTVSGSGYQFQGNAYQSSTVEVQANTNVEVNAIHTDTLTLGAGATLTIAAIPGGPQAANITHLDAPCHPMHCGLSSPVKPVAEPAAATYCISHHQPRPYPPPEPLAASTVPAAPAPASSEVASALASSDSISNTVLDAVAAPAAIVADIALPVRLVGSAPARRIDMAYQSPTTAIADLFPARFDGVAPRSSKAGWNNLLPQEMKTLRAYRYLVRCATNCRPVWKRLTSIPQPQP